MPPYTLYYLIHIDIVKRKSFGFKSRNLSEYRPDALDGHRVDGLNLDVGGADQDVRLLVSGVGGDGGDGHGHGRTDLELRIGLEFRQILAFSHLTFLILHFYPDIPKIWAWPSW